MNLKLRKINNLINGNLITFEEAIDMVISMLDIDLFMDFAASLDKESFEKLQTRVINSNNALFIYELAFIPGANINKLAQAIANSKDAKFIFYFARDIAEAPLDTLTKAIIETGNAKYIYFYTLYIENVSIEELTQGIVKTNNAKYMYFYALNVEKEDLIPLIAGIKKTNHLDYMFYFIRDINSPYTFVLVKHLIDLKAFIHLAKLVLLNKYQDYLLEIIINAQDLSSMLYIAKKTEDVQIRERLILEIQVLEPSLDVMKFIGEEQRPISRQIVQK